MTRQEFTNTQRHVLALMHLAQAVDNMNTIVYTDETKPELPGLNDYPVDIYIQTLTGHISYATAQFSALMHDAAKRIVDDADDEVDELQRLVAAYRQRDAYRAFFRLGAGGVSSDTVSSLFDSIFRTPASAFHEPEPVDDADPAVEPIPDGIFYDSRDATFRDATGADHDDVGGRKRPRPRTSSSRGAGTR
jgi:hypothetical protein